MAESKMEERVRAIEEVCAKVKIVGIIVSLVLSVTVIASLTWIGSLVHSLGEMKEAKVYHDKGISDLKIQIKELSEKHDATLKAHNKLRESVVVLVERQPKGLPNVPEVLVHHGKIIRISPDAITILPSEIGEHALKFTILKKTEVVIAEKGAELADLRIGTHASVMYLGDTLRVLAGPK